MRKQVAVVVGCLALVAAGCGGDDEDEGSADTGEATQERPATKEATSGGAAAKTAAVSMKGIAFAPATVAVAKGGSVTWTNDEAVPHDVTKRAGPGPQFSSGTGNLQQGDTYKRSFSEAGTVSYVCTVHPGMDGTVTVR
jgi:plastocyanin